MARSTAAAAKPDAATVRRALAMLIDPDACHEIRALPSRQSRIIRGDDLDRAVSIVLSLGDDAGVYFGLNPVRPNLGDRAATARDITTRRRLLIDIDRCKAVDPDAMATADEKAAATNLADEVSDFLWRHHRFPVPLSIDSGNGGHLSYRIELPNDAATKGLIKRFLESLATKFDAPGGATVDTKIFDAGRIAKLPGTWVRKGPNTPDRPWRMATIRNVPTDPSEVVTAEMMEAVIFAITERAAIKAESPNGQHANGNGVARPDPFAQSTTSRLSVEERAIRYLGTIEPAISGARGHDKTFAVACRIGPGFDLSEEVAFRLLRDHYSPKCKPPWSEAELKHKIRDAYKTEARRGWLLENDTGRGKASDGGARPSSNGDGRSAYNLTELGNAQRLAKRDGDVIRYCYDWRTWLTWDGKRWRKDNTGEIYRLAKGVVREIAVEGSGCQDEGRRKSLLVWSVKSETKQAIEHMVFLAQSEPGIAVAPDSWDRNQWLFNCLNGTVDLKTGELKPHRREDLITCLAPVRYDLDAKSKTWESFLADILPDKSLREFVQRILGIALTGDVSEQILPIFYGSGANGKSTLLGAVLGMMGEDHAITAPPGLLVKHSRESHPAERVVLFKKRLVIDMESAEGARLNENLVKQLTGSDQIEARGMRENFWSFRPTHKLVMGTNHRPAIKETKNSIWRRVKLVPFTIEIPERLQNKDLSEQLKEEYTAILAWCVQGCLDWQYNGLMTPQAVEEATQSYREEQDSLANFFAEECTLNAAFEAKASPLYARYQQWAQRSGEQAVSQKAFGLALVERGFHRKPNNGIWYCGIGLRPDGCDESQRSY